MAVQESLSGRPMFFCQNRKSSEAGFTLAEVLIALAILSTSSALLIASLKQSMHAERLVRQATLRMEAELALSHIQSVLDQKLDIRLSQFKNKEYSFFGNRENFQITSNSIGTVTLGGPSLVNWAISRQKKGKFVLSESWTPLFTGRADREHFAQPLIAQVDSVEFNYGESSKGNIFWAQNWSSDKIPEFIRIKLTTGDAVVSINKILYLR